jgi:uridine kinase
VPFASVGPVQIVDWDHAVEVVRAVAVTARELDSDIRTVAIDGRSGAGKSTFAARLASALDAPVFSPDVIYPGWDGLEQGVDLFGRWVLEPLAHREPAGLRTWDWQTGEFGHWQEILSAPIVVVEGVGTGAARFADCVSLLVWLECSPRQRRARAISRDGAVFEPHWDHWAAQEDAYLSRDQPADRADIVVSVDQEYLA